MTAASTGSAYSIFDHAQLGHTSNVNSQLRSIMVTRTPDETLRDTWQRERPHRPHWPANFHACMADPVVRAVIETLHRHVPAVQRIRSPRQLELQALDAAQAPAQGFRSMARPASPPAPAARRPWPFRDGKSASANDRDDDE